MSISVDHLSYSVPEGLRQKLHAASRYRYRRQEFCQAEEPFKPILRDISLDVQPGEFVAIIGSSGCGKTSLINIVCNRLYTKTFSGEVRFNGKRVGPWIKRRLGYVQQEDILGAEETVFEAVKFVADLKLPGRHHEELTDRTLASLGLAHVRDSLIGAPAGQGFSAGANKSGISGGERRRTSIARQIVSGAEVLVLDECTSGLDVHTANQLIATLKGLSGRPYDQFTSPDSQRHGLTVLTTIHQPTSQMWGLFDRVLVMRRGQLLFSIPAAGFLERARSAGVSLPENVNPADFLIELLADPSQEAVVERLAAEFRQAAPVPVRLAVLETAETVDPDGVDGRAVLGYTLSAGQQYGAYRADRKFGLLPHALISAYEVLHYEAKYVQSYQAQFGVLLSRAVRQQVRNPVLFFRFLLQYTVVALFAGSLWWRLGYTYTAVGNRIGAVFFIQITLVFPPSADAAQRWFQKRQVYLAEHAQGLYGTAGFFLAELLVDLPVYVFMVFYTIVIAYFMVNMNSSLQLCLLLGVQFLLMLYSTLFLALFFQFVFNSFVAAIAVFMTTVSILFTFAGPYINPSSVPSYWSWMPWVSQFAYMFRAYLYLILHGQDVVCDPGQSCPLDSGATMFELYGQQGWTLLSATLTNVGYTAGVIALFACASYLMLRYRRFS
ncbi:ABC transporter family protein [Spironucleus salmonicida]|uniref:ABC transporter family protein n=1 Tax=Spironucleus salmonicida TaxID=348837 RepID=V6LI03_9EUKA|nr:ABC transporter family protein [Spironucleus salmonicida]KAH0573941.1 ABC transporter family protein [Spironucleus salmonicida]|eukprot:EST44162.1 ABC transporter family protein [Spironucleus salmonicida]